MAVQPVHVATWIETGTRELAAPSVKQRLAALCHLFDWLVNGQVVPVNPAHRSHLTGKAAGNAAEFTAGIYPMLPDETYWFLAADFDKKSWKRDVSRSAIPRGRRRPRRDRANTLG
jgi:hypothetical protein